MAKILIIEDDIYLSDLLEQKIKGAGFEVDTARDGAVGLKKIRDAGPNLILLDINVPVMNGYELLEEKARDQKIIGIPVIVISNSGQPLEIDRVLALNVKDYFVKAQFDTDEVLAKIRLQLREMAPHDQVEPQSAPKAETVPGLTTKKIMFVEDDVFLSDIIAKKLSNEGCQLVHTAKGNEVAELAKKEMPDVILLDILLPGMDGFQALEQLKAIPETASIPVILLSNLGQKSDVEKGEKLGAVRFLVKATVTLDEIIDEIKKFIKIAK